MPVLLTGFNPMHGALEFVTIEEGSNLDVLL